MTELELLKLFSKINCARIGDRYAPHKPILILLILEKILNQHNNEFSYIEFDHDLKRLLEKYGLNNSSNTRNEPFWRLKNDGVWDIFYNDGFESSDSTPTPNQLLETNARGILKEEIYNLLKNNTDLINKLAHQLLTQFIIPRYQTPLLVDAAPTIKLLNRKYWWVSQNQTYKQEVPGNFMWSPKTNKNGGRNPSYDFMLQMMPGDIVFSFADTYIKAIGIVINEAVSSIKPNFGNAGSNWLDDGWLVDVAFEELNSATFKPAEFIHLLSHTLPDQYSPIRTNGIGNQIYLAPIPQEMANVLIGLSGTVGRSIVNTLSENIHISVPNETDEEETMISMRTDIGETQKMQIITSRRGQGVFKANLRLIESHCRVTKIAHSQHLIASHIKPWTKSTDEEKLSGYNGLLLSPHIDHLFDKGFISFGGDGDLILSKRLDHTVLDKWCINSKTNVGAFRTEQKKFLEYHRDVVLQT